MTWGFTPPGQFYVSGLSHVGSMFARELGPGRGGLCQIWPERGLRRLTWVGQWSTPLLGVLSFDSLIQLRSVKPAGSVQSYDRRTGRARRGWPEALRMRGSRHRCSSVTSAGGPLRLNRRVRWRPVPLENRIRVVTCGSSGYQAARAYSLIRPPRTGFRRIRLRSRSARVRWPPSCLPSGTRWAMPWCGRAVL